MLVSLTVYERSGRPLFTSPSLNVADLPPSGPVSVNVKALNAAPPLSVPLIIL
jgi:hypothetical protein